ncbi:NAD-dependent epimerase/dehydratase family protein [Polaribacter sp. KT 15]|uniref:NAD-dependent epimerase/dehydratase family protein n=1 Tax=Polaribacter sp. KT 15 TaxID=1896175 RepID=UPI00090BF47C|nr:NAD-dependent epimerase/dehydratase family protein [Polaribacter sp. KT 15]SHN09763.1 Nucleoside-diphosphate-sugar epimerase [Polaribacter sp. KT 15]
MANILVTGGAGNIGSSLVNKLAENQKNLIVIFDNLLTGSKSKIPKLKNVIFIKGNVNDYNDISAVFHRYNFNYVFHFAAVVGVQRTLNNPLWVLEDIKGFENILSLSKNTNVSKVYFSSSSEVYGEPFEIPQNEKTTPLNSKLPYAIVKNLGESYLKSYYQEFGLKYSIFRFFNTFGPNQSEDFVIPKFIKLAKSNKNITIFGEGKQTRTFCYIEDNIDTILKIHENSLVTNDVINIGNDREITVLELAKTIIKVTNSKSKIVYLPALKEGDMLRRCPDVTKMKSILQRDLLPLEDGIKKLIKQYEVRN